MPKMKAVQIVSAGGPFETIEREIPTPGRGQVRIKVKACGVCHGDSLTKEGLFPGIQYPRIPGHEIGGLIDAVSEGVTGWEIGQRVGIGWHGGHCGRCDSCRRGDFITCQAAQIPGLTYDGGYAEYMIAPTEALALIPDDLSFVDAGPLMCAGITTFNSLRNSKARAGDVVAVLGVGGLGHLAIQFAVKMGFKTIAIARGKEKEAVAKKLGAFSYIDSTEKNPADELKKLGGAKVILSTVTSNQAMSAVLDGLAVNGELIILGGVFEPMAVPCVPLILGRKSISGWPCGSSIDSQDTMDFCSMTDIRSINETYPLERAKEAYAHMMEGKARYRVVLTME